MPELPNTYAELQAEWFHNVAGKLHALKELSGTEYLTFGPQYRTTTRRGLPLHISTFIYPDQSQRKYSWGKDDPSLMVDAVAQSLNGTIEGFRIGVIYGKRDKHMTGQINMRQRNMGFATPLELAFMDVVNRLTPQVGTITQSVDDQNFHNFQYYAKVLSPDDAMFQELEDERLRWERLYGPNGLLGFDEKGKLQFKGNGISNHPLETIDTIDFHYREVKKGRRTLYEMTDVGVATITDPVRRNADLTQELNSVIIPQI